MSRPVESIFGAVVTAPHQIPYTFTAVGGETSISLPVFPVTGLVTIGGGVQVPLDNYEIEGNVLHLGGPLDPGDVVYCLFDKVLSPEGQNSTTRIYKFKSVGGETSFTPDFTSYGVQSLYIDGKYQTPIDDYTYNKETGVVNLTSAIVGAGKWVVAELYVQQNYPALAAPDGAGMIGAQLTAAGSVYRTQADKNIDTVSVKDFGAKGDGVTDDTASIQAALNSSHKRIYFPEGRYRIVDNNLNGTPTLTSTVSDRTLFGPGAITATGWVYTALYITGSRTVVHLNVDGNKFIGMAIDVAADGCVVSDCYIRDLFQPANQWLTVGVRAQFGMNDWSINVRGNTFDNFEAIGDGVGGNGIGMSRAVLLSATSNVTKLSLVTGNKISSIIGEEGDAIVVVSLNSGVYLDLPVLISNNTVTTWSRRAVKTQANKATIRGNVFRNTYTTNPGGMQHAVSLVQGGNAVVDSNTFIDCKYASQVGLVAGGASERVDNICITNNVVLGLGAETLFGAFAITTYGENVVVCNNHILCPNLGATAAISVVNALSGLVSGNNILVNNTSHYNFTGSANLCKLGLTNKTNTPGLNTSSSNEDALSINVYGSTNRSLTLYNWDGVLSDGEIISRIQFHQNDDNAPNLVQGSIRAVAVGTSGAMAMTFHTGGGAQTSDAERLRITIGGNIEPGADGTQNLASASKRFNNSYFAVAPTVTSDGREKSEPEDITEAMLDAADDIDIVLYQWLESITTKGEDTARWHFGAIAQQIGEAFSKHGLDGRRFGLLCYDEWEDKWLDVFVDVYDEGGNIIDRTPTGEKQLILAAGNRWGIRPDQCHWLLAAAAKRRAKRAEDRLASIEERLTRMEKQ